MNEQMINHFGDQIGALDDAANMLYVLCQALEGDVTPDLPGDAYAAVLIAAIGKTESAIEALRDMAEIMKKGDMQYD